MAWLLELASSHPLWLHGGEGLCTRESVRRSFGHVSTTMVFTAGPGCLQGCFSVAYLQDM